MIRIFDLILDFSKETQPKIQFFSPALCKFRETAAQLCIPILTFYVGSCEQKSASIHKEQYV